MIVRIVADLNVLPSGPLDILRSTMIGYILTRITQRQSRVEPGTILTQV
jgi:hypothetical protein